MDSALKSLPLRLAFILLTGFTVAILGAHTFALNGPRLSNPFAVYADIFPGQPASAIETRAFSCPSDHNYYQAPSGLYCSFTPENGAFSYIGVVILGNIIQQITFIMRENRLTVGDLELIFETRAVHKFAHTVYFALPRQGNFAITRTSGYEGRFSVFLPVRSIYFTRIALPVNSQQTNAQAQKLNLP